MFDALIAVYLLEEASGMNLCLSFPPLEGLIS